MKKNNQMPWMDLIWAFLKDAASRTTRPDHELLSPENSLRELRTLVIGGVRQSGKSKTAAEVVRTVDAARLMGGWILRANGRQRVFDVPADKSIEPHELVEAKLKNVKTIVIDPDMVSPGAGYDYYEKIVEVYSRHPEWFHPEFSVVRFVCP